MYGFQKSLSIAFAVAAFSSPAMAQGPAMDRVAAATQAIERGCSEDVKKFCGSVTRGDGRLIQCMQAFDDQLSRQCQFSLYMASRGLRTALNRVERVADACWNDIQAKCKDADRIGQCIVDNHATVSKACQRVVGVAHKAVQGLAGLRGMQVYSSDNKHVGRIAEVKRAADGTIESVRVEVGRLLGLGHRMIEVTGNDIERLADRIKLRMDGDKIRALPEAPKPQ